MIKIVLDVFSGDNPDDLIMGATQAVNDFDDVTLVMPGEPKYLENVLSQYEYDHTRIEILPANEIISNNESPTVAVRQKKNSTLVRGATLLSRNEADGMISAGATGAVLCSGIFIVGRLKGVSRPALAPLLPTAKGGYVCLVDCGANSDCRASYLAQFALLGTGLMQSAVGIKEPKVAIVNVGTEEHKGNSLTADTMALLKSLPINFVGNMEARDALSGNYDVLVCDGFVGNVLLKSIEGTARLVSNKILENVLKNNPNCYEDIKKAVDNAMLDFDYNSNGGAWLLGCNKPMMKIHGASNANTVKATVGVMRNMVSNNFASELFQNLEKILVD